MRAIKFILVTAIMCSFASCYAQSSKKIEDKEFQVLLDRFRTVKPPLNYKKIVQPISSMTKEEAIRFFHKTEEDLYSIEIDYGYDTDEISYYKEENTAGCDFKYQLNDSIYILCTREGGKLDTNKVYLSTFTLQGEIIDRCVVGEQFTYENDWISFVLLDKTHIRIFYYVDNFERKLEGFFSTVYYMNYEITDEGKFIKQNKSGITYLKDYVIKYSTYKPKSDDPMNDY